MWKRGFNNNSAETSKFEKKNCDWLKTETNDRMFWYVWLRHSLRHSSPILLNNLIFIYWILWKSQLILCKFNWPVRFVQMMNAILWWWWFCSCEYNLANNFSIKSGVERATTGIFSNSFHALEYWLLNSSLLFFSFFLFYSNRLERSKVRVTFFQSDKPQQISPPEPQHLDFFNTDPDSILIDFSNLSDDCKMAASQTALPANYNRQIRWVHPKRKKNCFKINSVFWINTCNYRGMSMLFRFEICTRNMSHESGKGGYSGVRGTMFFFRK